MTQIVCSTTIKYNQLLPACQLPVTLKLIIPVTCLKEKETAKATAALWQIDFAVAEFEQQNRSLDIELANLKKIGHG